MSSNVILIQDKLKTLFFSGHEETRDEFYDYGQALQDSPPSADAKLDLLENLSDALGLADEEPLENLIAEISSQMKDSIQEGMLEVEKLKKETNDSHTVMGADSEIVEHPNESDSDSEMIANEKETEGEETKNPERQITNQKGGGMAKSIGFEKLSTDLVVNPSQIKRSILSQTMKEQPLVFSQ